MRKATGMLPYLSGIAPLELNLATRFSVGDMLTRSTQLFADRTAIVDGEEEISYARLDAAAEAFGRGLLDAGVQHQEPVAFLLGNSWRFAASFFGCAKAGLVALPVNLMLAPADIGWILSDSGTRVVVADPPFVPLLEAVLPSLPQITTVILTGEQGPESIAGRPVRRWDDIAVDPTPVRVIVEDRDTVHCLYTSGTTARPKGVLTSHLAVHVGVLSNALQVGHRRGDESSVLPIVLPLFHTTALDTLLLPVLLTGGTAVLPGGFEPEGFLEIGERRSATHLMLLPMMYAALLASPGIRTGTCPRCSCASTRWHRCRRSGSPRSQPPSPTRRSCSAPGRRSAYRRRSSSGRPTRTPRRPRGGRPRPRWTRGSWTRPGACCRPVGPARSSTAGRTS